MTAVTAVKAVKAVKSDFKKELYSCDTGVLCVNGKRCYITCNCDLNVCPKQN